MPAVASLPEAPSCGPARFTLPPRMKVLYITTLNRTGGWLAEAFAADSASQLVFDEVVGATAGLARLRQEAFDAVLVSHEPGVLDALELVEGMRAGGGEEPILVLGNEPPQNLDALCFESGADDYCCVAETTVRGMLWKLARAMQHHQLARDHRQMMQGERSRLQQEQREAERLLEQQRALITDLESLKDGRAPDDASVAEAIGDCLAMTAAGSQLPTADLPDPLVDHYRELLRAYVIMGAGNLAEEMATLAELLAATGVSAQRAMQLHVNVLEELVHGLGNRSARHVMSRADLLALEVIGHLADGYRRRYHERRSPARQQMLPGFDDLPSSMSPARRPVPAGDELRLRAVA